MSASVDSEEHKLPCWYYEKADLKKTPSFHDGVPHETETRYRREGPKFIFQMGTKLGLHYATIATAVVYFHRFYMFHSFKKVHRHVAATCCLFIAGKVEETPKKCRDLIKIARSLLSDAHFSHFGDDPREEVMTMEKMCLHSIRFDFFVEHPYSYILKYAKALKGDNQKIGKLVQMAWTFVNDSLSTSLCLLWEPQIIAVAVMYLAGRLCKFEPQDWAYNRGRWWEQFIDDITPDLLEEICHQILDQYSNSGVAKAGANKGKRERPKTPKDNEPQAKVQRTGDVRATPKVKPQATTEQPASAKKSASRISTVVSGGQTTTATPLKPIQTFRARTDSETTTKSEQSSAPAPPKPIETVRPPLPTAAEPVKPSAPLPSESMPGTPEHQGAASSSYLENVQPYQSYHNAQDFMYMQGSAVAAASPASYTAAAAQVSQTSSSSSCSSFLTFPTTFPTVNMPPSATLPPPPIPSFPPPPAHAAFAPPPDFHAFPPPITGAPAVPSYAPPPVPPNQVGFGVGPPPPQPNFAPPMPPNMQPHVRITGRREQQNQQPWL